ncbi:glycosyl hydrolase family 18 protein [Pseudomonadota bacterium]
MNQNNSKDDNHIVVYSSTKKTKTLLLKLLPIVLSIILIPLAAHLYSNPNTLITPLSSGSTFFGLPHSNTKPNKVVFGFIPYWNFKHLNQIPFQHLSHLGVFGIAFDSDGTIQTREQDYTEPGYRAFQLDNFSTLSSLAKASDTKLILVIRGFDNDTIDSIISSPEHTQNFIDNTLAFVQKHEFDGVNLDFEYLGSPEPKTINQFTAFVSTLSQALKKHNSNYHFSLDVFADSSVNQRIWDLPKLHHHLDHLIIMAYDFHRPSSQTAGPIAPLFGTNPELAINRQHEVLRRMVEDEYITQDQADQAKNQELKFATNTIQIKAPHFALYVKDLLTQEYGEQLVERGGLRVTTTLDLDLHESAQASLSAEIDRLEKYKVQNGAAIITKPNTGEILSMIGSTDFFDRENDGQVNVTLRHRQPGSSIKPLNYATAFEIKKATPATMVLDIPTCFDIVGQPLYCPKNYDGSFHGPTHLRFALGNSYNIPAVKVLAINDLETFIATASAMGISTFKNPDNYGLSLTLGVRRATLTSC